VAAWAPPLATGPFNGLTLEDDKGHVVPAQYQVNVTVVPGGQPKFEFQITCRPDKEKRRPTRLAYTARRSASVEIAFTLKDVKLP
jgi:hypothetical protein